MQTHSANRTMALVATKAKAPTKKENTTKRKLQFWKQSFLLHTEIPFFLKNITCVLKQSLSLFDAKEPDGLKQQAGAGNVIVDNKSSTIKGHALIRGTKLAKANLTLVPQGKRSLFKTEMLQNKSIVLPQAVNSRNYTQRALEGARAWLHACSVFQQNKGEFGSLTKKETIRVVFHHLEKSQIALEELSREVSAARAVLSSSSTLHFPSLDAVSKVFHSSPIPNTLLCLWTCTSLICKLSCMCFNPCR